VSKAQSDFSFLSLVPLSLSSLSLSILSLSLATLSRHSHVHLVAKTSEQRVDYVSKAHSHCAFLSLVTLSQFTSPYHLLSVREQGMLQCVAVCCSVLQCAAVCCFPLSRHSLWSLLVYKSLSPLERV